MHGNPEIFDKVLTLHKMSDEQRYEKEPVDLEADASHAVDYARREPPDRVGRARGARDASLRALGGREGRVLASRLDLIQVLTNCLSNAFKFAPDRARGGRISLDARLTTLDEFVASGGRAPDSAVAAAELACVEFAVRDNGPGIRADDCKRIFEPYAQARHGASQVKGGTGLGLAISKDIVTKGHGGTIRADSVLGRGTAFVVHICFARTRARGDARRRRLPPRAMLPSSTQSVLTPPRTKPPCPMPGRLPPPCVAH